MLLLGMFIVLLVLVYAYGFEYVRYKTVKNYGARRINKVLFGWLALLGLFAAVRISLILGVFAWALAVLGYLYDAYIVDRMP